MALPRTVPNARSDTSNHCDNRPYLSSTGNVYVVGRNQTDFSKLGVWKTTDPVDTAFSEQDAGNAPDLTNAVECFGVVQDGDDLHIVTQDQADVDNANVKYHVFHMATDQWDGTIVNETVVSGYNRSLASKACSIMLRGDGDVIVAYTGAEDAYMGTPYDQVYYARRESAVWTIDVLLSNNSTELYWRSARVVKGPSDRSHFAFNSFVISPGADSAYQRTLKSDNTLETFPGASDTTVYQSSQQHVIPSMVAYEDGGTTRIRVAYVDRDGTIALGEYDSADTPGTWTINSGVGDFLPETLTWSFSFGLAVDGTDVHLLYARDSNGDIYHDKNKATDVNERTLTAKLVHTNVYTRSGTKRLAFLYMETGDYQYDEIDLEVTEPQVLGRSTAHSSSTTQLQTIRSIAGASAAFSLGAAQLQVQRAVAGVSATFSVSATTLAAAPPAASVQGSYASFSLAIGQLQATRAVAGTSMTFGWGTAPGFIFIYIPPGGYILELAIAP